MPAVNDLARWIHGFRAEDVPPEAVEKAKLHLLDSLGCAYGALEEPAALGAIRAAAALGGSDCTVIGTPVRASVAAAVLANGTLVRTLDLNDLGAEEGTAGHPSDNIAAGLAVAERGGCSGRDLLAAIVLGYEIYCRMPHALGRPNRWDGSTASGLVASAMAGWLLRLSPERLADALALAIAHCNTLSIVRRGQLSAAKSLANAMVTHTAVVATLLAAEGVTGPPTVLEEWREAVLGGADLAPLTQPLSGGFRIMRVSHKAHPCIGTGQAAVEAAIRARALVRDPSDVAGIDVYMADTPFVRSQVADGERRDPATRETADHSFPYLVAVAFLDGELTLRQFADGRWFDPEVRSLMDRITVETDPTLNQYVAGGFPCTLRVRLHDGGERRVEVPYAPGNIRNPLGPEGVEAKFRRFAAPHVPPSQQQAIVDAVNSLEKLPDVREFAALLALPG